MKKIVLLFVAMVASAALCAGQEQQEQKAEGEGSLYASERLLGYDQAIEVDGQLLKPKSPLLAAAASFALPGWGQRLNGQKQKGKTIMCVYCASVGVSMLALQIPYEMDIFGIADTMAFVGMLTSFGTWLYSLIDAPLYASKWNDHYGFELAEGTWLRVDPRVGMANPYGTAPAVGLGATITF